MRTCPNCGENVEPSNLFCGRCGTPLDAGTQAPREGFAERRRVTVLFCDLVGSTDLSDVLDPEDYSDVMQRYYESCRRVIEGLGGWIADYLGDGVVVYFGYPAAHEDDPVRAVRAGLALVEAVSELGAGLASADVNLACRVGIETGLVVIGDIISKGVREPIAALGRTVNLAARLQSIASPHSVVIGDGTRSLVEGWFHLEPLGAQSVKGISRPLEVHRVIVETAAKNRLHAALPRGLAPLADRGEELAVLFEAWERAAGGNGGVVLLRGEAGIGKSRLALTLLERLRGGGVTLVDLYCSPDDAASPLRPVVEYLERKVGFEPEDGPERRLAKLGDRLGRLPSPDPEALALLADILVPAATPSPIAAPPVERRRRAMEILAALLLGERPPALVLIEDAHWADPSTAELVGLLVERIAGMPALAVLTARPEFDAPWLAQPHVARLDVPRLSGEHTAELAASVAGARLPREADSLILARTDGVPLFIEELTRMALDSGLVSVEDGRAVVRGRLDEAVPGTVYDLLVARLGRLGSDAGVAQFAAVLGNEFRADLLRAVVPEQRDLEGTLSRLVDAGVVQRRGEAGEESFRFSHALVRDAAYSLLLRKRRRELHGRVADTLIREFPDAIEARPELAAPHLTESGRIPEAIEQWTKAGGRAAGLHALHEAIGHYTRALELVRELPGSPERARREIAISFALGPVIQNASGFGDPRVGEMYGRVAELSHWLESDSERFTFLALGFAVLIVHADYEAARKTAVQLVEVASRSESKTRQLLAHTSLGTVLFQLGEIAEAMPSIERVVELYDPARHERLINTAAIDPGAVCIGYRAWGEWHLGYADRARATARDLIELTTAHPHPFRTATAHVWVAGLAQRLREPDAAARHSAMAIDVSAERGYEELERYARCVNGWAVAASGDPARGAETIRRGLELVPHGGSRAHFSWHLSMLAEAELWAGRLDAGREAIERAKAFAAETGERMVEPELWRLEGEILRESGASGDDVESAFRTAAEAARRRGSLPFALRAAVALHRLRGDLESKKALAAAYEAFAEGLDTRDLVEARALLEGGATS